MDEQKPKEFPSNPMNQDLYSQIAAGDEVRVEKKHKPSLIMSVMVDFMRLTLYLDEKRRAHQQLFRVLGNIWGGMMALLYLCGIMMFIILVYSYIQFPSYVRQYFERNGILFTKMDIPGYVVSRVELRDLHDKDNTYHIDRLIVHSTFSDFLNGRAKNVVLNGLKLTLDETTGQTDSNNLLRLLLHLNDIRQSQIGIRVDSLEISDAMVTIKGRDYTLPVSFSLTGVYGQETNMSAYVTVDESWLSFKGPLLIRGNNRGTNWDLDIQSGTVTFPSRPPEKLSGKIAVDTRDFEVQSMSADIKILYNRFEKVAQATFNRDRSGTFKGTVDLTWQDIADDGVGRNVRSNINLAMAGITFGKGGSIKTNDPITLTVKSNYSKDIQVGRLNGQLRGELSCQLYDSCLYRLKDPVQITMNQVRFPVPTDVLESSRTVTMTLNPTDQTFGLFFRKGLLAFDLAGTRIGFNGKRSVSEESVSLRADRGTFKGVLDLIGNETRGALTATGISYDAPDQEMKRASLSVSNIFGSDGSVVLESPQVTLKNNEYLKAPFDLDYQSVNGTVRSVLKFKREGIQIIFGGQFDPLTGALDGQIVIPPFELSKLRQPLFRFSSVFPSGMKQVSGRVAVFGRIGGTARAGLNGPLYVAFENVNLATDQMKVAGLNTVLTIQTLRPFVTAASQQMFIREVGTVLPFQNVGVFFKIDNQFVRLSSLMASVAGIPLQSDVTIIPYRDISTLVYLKSLNRDLSAAAGRIKALGWEIDGQASGDVLLPLEIKNNQIAIKNASIRLTDGTGVYKGAAANKPAFLGKDNKVRIRSGEITIDEPLGLSEETSVQFNLEGILEPSGKRETIRESFRGSIRDWIKEASSKEVLPATIRAQQQAVFEQTEKLRVK